MNISRGHIELMFEYCKSKWGKSAFHNDFPKLRVYKKSPKSKVSIKYGQFNSITNTLTVYIGSHRSLIEICDTVIHEYTHYLQDVEGMYDKYLTKYYRTYDNHPYEITARNRGMRYKKECRKFVRDNLAD